ncbi:MAG: class I SAM-dependent methyltransferase [Proteobacteria bacterium]|nr:class I SAM-dependent methyltransferase [Pseudomonadota bacterium]
MKKIVWMRQYSTVALHHLPDVAALKRTFSEVARVLKPGGGVLHIWLILVI